jgi:formate dehydrogenase maturation protein FdhE
MTNKRKFTPDNIQYWTGDNVSQEILFNLIADLANNIYTVEEFRKDLTEYFDGLEYEEVKSMNAKQLIAELQKLPEETVVFIWNDGSRLEICSVDDSLVDDGYADINIKVQE